MNEMEKIINAVLGGQGKPFGFRKFVVDYKTTDGRDMNRDSWAIGPRWVTDDDAAIVRRIMAEHAKNGERVTCIGEVDPLEGTALACLYLDREEMFAYWKELGIKPPTDLKAALEHAGIRPVNYEDLVKGE